MTRVLLVRPPFYSAFGTETKTGNIPLGLCYLAASLEQEGFHTEILDCETLDFGDKDDAGAMRFTNEMNIRYDKYAEIMGSPDHPVWENVSNLILHKSPDIIGFTAQTTGMSPVIYVSQKIKKRTQTPIILGGAHATVMPEASLKETGVDAIVLGEGERTIIELILALLDDTSLKNVDGIAYREDSRTIITPPRKRIEILDDLPFPARHLLQPDLYKTEAFGYLISSRGCPFDCSFCASKRIWGRQARFRSAENILGEIEAVQSTYGTDHFRFADDIFTLNKKRVIAFCDGVKRRGLKITFRCGSRTDTVDAETLLALSEAGCTDISFGIESGSQRILNLIRKQTTVEQAEDAIKKTKAAGINTIAFFIIGHPTETVMDINATVNLIERIDAHRTTVNLMTPYPGIDAYSLDMSRDWWRYYFQGKSVQSISALDPEKLNEIYEKVSRWVTKRNLGEAPNKVDIVE